MKNNIPFYRQFLSNAKNDRVKAEYATLLLQQDHLVEHLAAVKEEIQGRIDSGIWTYGILTGFREPPAIPPMAA